MAKNNTFFLTTPLYYVNDQPHIGHAYTTIAADILARFKRLEGSEVYFLTGTDEHGQKILKASSEANMAVENFVESVVPRFLSLWQKLEISYDDFIRTTQPRHARTVQKALNILYEKKDIELKAYEGWYCTPCETFWPKETICPDCQRPLEKISEENYFFKLSKYQGWLVDYIKAHPGFIQPQSRRNEVLSFLDNPLLDLCISRPKSRLSWGIPLPFSPGHVTYVWFDALINYISAVGYFDDAAKFEKFWPAAAHFVGKDIVRQHAVYWPVMLHALGLEIPRTVFAHGWWTIGGEKMSKSRGNVVRPAEVIEKYGADVFRYFLMREIPFGLDGVYSEEALILRFNSDLANDLGNLVHRTLTMVEKYFNGQVPSAGTAGSGDAELINKGKGLGSQMELLMDKFDFCQALSLIWELINSANKYIENSAPWKVARNNERGRLEAIIYNLVETLRLAAIAVYPFMPGTAANIWQQLGFGGKVEDNRLAELKAWGLTKAGIRVQKGNPLFPRIINK